MGEGVAFAAVKTRAEGIKVTGKVGFTGHPMIEHYRFVADHTKVTPKITIPAPSAIYGRPTPTPIDKTAYPDLDGFFHDVGQAYRKAVRAFADAGCRYLQLDEVFIAMLCDEKYRQQMRDRGDDPEKLGEIYGDLINVAMSDIPVRHDDHDAHVPRQLQIHLHGRGRLRRRAGDPVQQDQRARLFHGIRRRALGRLRAAAHAAEGQAGRARPRDDEDRHARKQGRSEAPHRRGREIRAARSALPLGPVRLRLDRGRQHADRGRAMGEARAASSKWPKKCGDRHAAHQTAVPRRSCRQLPAHRRDQGRAREAREGRDHGRTAEGGRRRRDQEDHRAARKSAACSSRPTASSAARGGTSISSAASTAWC